MAAAVHARTKLRPTDPPPPGNTGTHWTGPNTYLLSQLQRANFITSRRTPFAETPDNLIAALQRLVHHEGNRPPNRKILLHLRLLTYYPPNPTAQPELVMLIESENIHVCRLAHYHLRQAAPINDPEVYRDLMEALEREVLRPSPARRAAATKSLAKIFSPTDVARATDFVMDVFNCIGGARAKVEEGPAPRTIAGVEIPGTDKNKKKADRRTKLDNSRLGQLNAQLFSKKVVSGQTRDVRKGEEDQEDSDRRKKAVDDGAGGVVQSSTGNAEFIKSRFGKMLVGHSVFAAMRRINRVAIRSAKVESYFFDSGLLSVVPSTVRHCMALLELRSTVAAGGVSRYLAPRLPHRNPPASKRLHLEELSARVYFARLLSALAEDPNLSAFIPEEAPKQAKRENRANNITLKEALAGPTVKEKASNLFKFLFNKDRVSQVVGAVKTTTTQAISTTRPPLLKRDDPLGVEFAEALVNLLKNASNRVLIEALRGLSRRRWTTWFEAPIPQGALYNSPELQDAEAYGGTADAWGLGEDEDDDEYDVEDENELGAYENDVAGDEEDGSKGLLKSSNSDPLDPAVDDLNPSGGKDTWFSRLNLKRQERRNERIDKSTPFYLRKVGQGMVPALEVILRRINAGLLHDEPIQRFSAADAVIVLARAKIYGHTRAEHERLRKAQSHAKKTFESPSSSRALVPTGIGAGTIIASGGLEFAEAKNPFEGLVRPLTELVEEDPNQFVRGRAAVALLFIITTGAGRNFVEADELDIGVSEEALARTAKMQKIPLLMRYFKGFVTHESTGNGIGLRLVSEVIDYLVYEVLDVAPELAPSAVEMADAWAMAHPTVGVCGRLGALWEKVLSISQGEVVGKSIFRAVGNGPRAERVASAAVIFLRRRTLDLAIITVGTSQVSGMALPEPLPRAVGVEMEKYFSLLWHAALLGPSAECRTFAVEALGGAAVLAGEPFRCCTYERLVELVRMRGLGLKIPAEQVLNALDMLYFSRERFSEARAKNRIARDGSTRSKAWLELVWRLAAESSSAAQILLGVPPPTGWQALGPGGASDLGNSEKYFGDVRDRQDDSKIKDATIVSSSAPGEAPLLSLEDIHPAKGLSSSPRKIGSGRVGDVPTSSLPHSSQRFDGDGSRSRSRSRERSSSRHPYNTEFRNSSPREQFGAHFDDNDSFSRSPVDDRFESQYRSRSVSPRNFDRPRSRSAHRNDDLYDDELVISQTMSGRHTRWEQSSEAGARRRQEDADHEIAKRHQEELNAENEGVRYNENSGGGGDGGGGGAKDVLAGASDAAGKLLGKGRKITGKAMKAAAQSGAADKLRNFGSSSKQRYP